METPPSMPPSGGLRSIWVNPLENRLRGGWRLLILTLGFLAASILVQLLLGIVIGIYMMVAGLDVFDTQAIITISESPPVRLITSLASLLLILGLCAIAARWMDKRPFRAYGFHFNRQWWADMSFGLFLGAFLMLVIFLVERSAGWVAITTQPLDGRGWLALLISLIVFLCVGITEELFSRGYQTLNLAEALNFPSLGPKAALLLAYLLTSFFFGGLHLFNPNASLTSTLYLGIAGLFLGLGFILTGELALPIGLHITWNFFQGNVFGFPVSGTTHSASLIQIQQGGPEIWTGGAFGPEAGLIGLGAIILGAVLILVWVRLTRGRVSFATRLAEYSPTGQS